MNGKEICKKISTNTAKKLLLNNLKSTKHLNFKNLILPMQKQANCWFNSFFSIFFVSDKGRKFFRFFRQLMIEGKKIDNKGIKHTIKSDNLRNAFGLLNLCIEACYNQKNNNLDLGLALDTNNIISAIYNSIPKSSSRPFIVDVDKANNPLWYYKNIMNYLQSKHLNILDIVGKETNDIYMSILSKDRKKNRLIYDKYNKLPDVITIIVEDENELKTAIPKTFNLHNNKLNAKYTLDSAVVRDTKRMHFCSLLTLNNKGKGYDGASFSRMNNFNWIKYINSDIDWTFEGSAFENKQQIIWNFKKSMFMLFYYRVL